MSNQIILKTEISTVFHLPKIDKIIGILNAENIAKLLEHVMCQWQSQFNPSVIALAQQI